MQTVKAIAAADLNGGIGKSNELLCKLEKDLKQFKSLTTGNIVIMGRKTFDSIGKALPDRINIVVSSQMSNSVENTDELIFASTPLEALRLAERIAHLEQHIYVIGGAQIYEELLPYCDEVLISEIQDVFDADTFITIPSVFHYKSQVASFSSDKGFNSHQPEATQGELDGEHRVKFFEHRQVANATDLQYKALCKSILNMNRKSPDRTGAGTTRLFAPEQIRIDLNEGFPLLTTKQVPFRVVAEELLWFVSGSTDIRDLHKRNVHIWDDDMARFANNLSGTSYSSKEYKEALRSEGNIPHDLGPIYGSQWRGNYAESFYKTAPDQLANVIESIKTDPYGRRHIVDSWNPVELNSMALPPCHFAYQFFVQDNELSCKFMMRSTDVFLGLPFNIASYALLTHMIARVTGLGVGELIVSFGDAHIYNNHIEQVKQLLKRPSRSLPTLEIVGHVTDIDSFSVNNFKLIGYHPHGPLKADINVGK